MSSTTSAKLAASAPLQMPSKVSLKSEKESKSTNQKKESGSTKTQKSSSKNAKSKIKDGQKDCKQMSIMAFVKKKKEAALASRVLSYQAPPTLPENLPIDEDSNMESKKDAINSEETFNANKNFLAAFESFIDSETGKEEAERKIKEDLIEKERLRTIKMAKIKSKDDKQDSSPKKKDKDGKHSPKKKDKDEKTKKKKEESPKKKDKSEKKKSKLAEESHDLKAKPEVELKETVNEEAIEKDKNNTKDNQDTVVDDSMKKDDQPEPVVEKDITKISEEKKEKETESKTPEGEPKDNKTVDESTKDKKEDKSEAKPEEPSETVSVSVVQSSEKAKTDEKKPTAASGDADFENMGYVSGDDAGRYSDDEFKADVDKPVNAPKPAEKIVNSEEEGTGTSSPCPTINKSPVLLSRNVAELEPTTDVEGSKDVNDKVSSKDESKESDASASKPFSPSVEDELNALKPVGNGEKEKPINSENSRLEQNMDQSHRSSCMLEQQQSQASTEDTHDISSTSVSSYNPHQDQSKVVHEMSNCNSQSLYGKQQSQDLSHHSQDLGPSLGVYTPDSATNSVHSIHGGFGNAGEVTEGSVQNIMESPNSISSVDMNSGTNNSNTSAMTTANMETAVGTPQSHMTQHTTPQHQPQYDQQQQQQSHIQHHAQQQQQQQPQIPCASPHMAAQSPHHPPSLPSQSPHSQHMTSPHPQPSPHAASNHSQQTSPHPITIPPAANSPYSAVPQPSPGASQQPAAQVQQQSAQQANTANQSQTQQTPSRAPARSPQQNSQSVANHHLQNMQRFYGNYGHFNAHGNYQGIPHPMFPPTASMFPVAAGMGLPTTAHPNHKKGEPHIPISSTQASAATSSSCYYGNASNTAAAVNQTSRHATGSLAQLQKLTNGFTDIPGLTPGMPTHPLPPQGTTPRSGSSKQAAASALSSRNSLLTPGSAAAAAYGYPPQSMPPHNSRTMHHRNQSAAAATANFMQYSQNHLMSSYAAQAAQAAQYNHLMHQFPAMNMYHHATAAADQRGAAGTPHPAAAAQAASAQATNPHHMYPNYPGYLGYR